MEHASAAGAKDSAFAQSPASLAQSRGFERATTTTTTTGATAPTVATAAVDAAGYTEGTSSASTLATPGSPKPKLDAYTASNRPGSAANMKARLPNRADPPATKSRNLLAGTWRLHRSESWVITSSGQSSPQAPLQERRSVLPISTASPDASPSCTHWC